MMARIAFLSSSYSGHSMLETLDDGDVSLVCEPETVMKTRPVTSDLFLL